MSDRIRSAVFAFLATASPCLLAEDHTAEALKHAAEAASATDSKSVGVHAEQALQHIDAAKAASGAPVDPHVKQGEADLNTAVQHSNWHNTDRATQEAADGKAHLEQAGDK